MVQTKWLVAQIIFNTAEDESSKVWQMAPPDDPKNAAFGVFRSRTGKSLHSLPRELHATLQHCRSGGAGRRKSNPIMIAWKWNELWEARSLLYRRRFSKPNNCWKSLDEICKIYILLHLSDRRNKATFRQHSLYFQNSNKNHVMIMLSFSNFVANFADSSILL